MDQPRTEEAARQEASPALNAAVALWEHLAAFAWDSYLVCGPGVVVLDQQALDDARTQQSEGKPVTLRPGYAPLTDIPPGDDFMSVIKSYDPKRQIVLIVAPNENEDRDEQLLVIECGPGGRPSPQDCFLKLNPSR